MTDNLRDPIDLENVTFDAFFVKVDDGVSLLVRKWTPSHAAEADPAIFVPGWVSTIDGWLPLLKAVVANRPVFYIESREKGSAEITRNKLVKEDFTVEQMAEDLIAAFPEMGLSQGKAIVMGSSLGSTSVLHAMKNGRLPCKAAFVIGPNSEFPYPWWGQLLVSMPAKWYPTIRKIVLWYMRHFRVDAKREPEQMQRYENTLAQANPVRIRLSANVLHRYKLFPDLETVQQPVGVAFAPSDKLHNLDGIHQILSTLPNAVKIECESNRYMHSEAMAKELEIFLDKHLG